MTQNIRVDSLLGALVGNIAETCRDALASGEMCVLAVADEWSQEQSAEFKAIVEQVTKVRKLYTFFFCVLIFYIYFCILTRLKIKSNFKFKVSRTLSKAAAAWLATKQAGNLNDLKRDETEEKTPEVKSVLVIRIGGTSASGEFSN